MVTALLTVALSNSKLFCQEEATDQSSLGQESEVTLDPSATFSVLNVDLATFSSPLGFDVEAVDAALRAHMDLPEGAGVVITSIMPDSEAAKIDLQLYDVIVTIDDQPITSPEMFHEVVDGKRGTALNLNLIRHGVAQTLTFTPPAVPTYALAIANPPTSQYRIGVTLAQADDTLRSQLRLAAGEGLVVTEVVADGPAASAGIRTHDVLTKLDDRRLSTVENLDAQVQEVKDRSVRLDFLRSGQEMSCELAPQMSNDVMATLAYRDVWVASTNALELVQRDIGAGEIVWSPDEHVLATSSTSIAGQLAELKQQLAAMQKSLEALEAALQQTSTVPAEAPMP